MKEDFLHYVWRTQSFDFHNLKTTDGESLEILDFGHHNDGAGPDFHAARIRLGEIEWAGNVEMHISSSEWDRHRHSGDAAYTTVILHVVLEDDVPVFTDGRKLPCLELRSRIDGKLLGRYLRLIANTAWVPCAAHLPSVPVIHKSSWLDRMLVERIREKSAHIDTLLEETKRDWEEVFYRMLATSFGFKVNSIPFERLARLVPLGQVYRHSDNLMQLEAMYFGAAGMLNRIFTDAYPNVLRREYDHLATKYGGRSIDAHAWKWGRLRPSNFPALRIAQFAALMQGYRGLFRTVIETPEAARIRPLFDVKASEYWSHHSDFDRPSGGIPRHLGAASVNGILINTIVPFLYTYGAWRNDETYLQHAVDLITTLPAEKNRITTQWVGHAMPNAHAGHSQALLHLKKMYCDAKACVRCAIGNAILSSAETGDL